MLALQQKLIKPEERILFLDLAQFLYLTTILTLYENPGHCVKETGLNQYTLGSTPISRQVFSPFRIYR